VDWESLLPLLKSLGFDGYLTLEPVMHMDHAVEAYINGSYQSGMVYGSEGSGFISDCKLEGTIEVFALEPIKRNRIQSFY
jgi:hypothetical protein